MAILVALAAILVPLLPEFLGKANQSVAATNLGEMDKWVPTFRATYGRYPNYFDSLLDSSGAISGFVAKPTPPGGAQMVTSLTLTEPQANRLIGQGVTEVYDLLSAIPATTDPAYTDFNATLNPYGTPPAHRTIVAGSKLLALAKTAADGGYDDEVFDRSVMPGVILDDSHDYVLLGIGKYCNLCGPNGIVREAPFFGQHKAQNTPATSYQRLVAVFDVGNSEDDDPRRPAKFVGMVAMVGKRFFTAGDISGTYSDGRFDISQPIK
jgi:hypothetical protein